MELIVALEKCNKCGDCTVFCPVRAIRPKSGIPLLVDRKSCCGVSCRICARQCSKRALTLKA